MADAPAFDPSQPFEPVLVSGGTPAFDPSKPFETVSAAPAGSATARVSSGFDALTHPAAPEGGWGNWAERGISGIPGEIAATAAPHLQALREGYEAERAPGTAPPGYEAAMQRGFHYPWEGPVAEKLKQGWNALGALSAPIAGTIRSVGGQGLAALEHGIGSVIAPEIAAKDDPQRMYEQAAHDVEVASMGLKAPGFRGSRPMVAEAPHPAAPVAERPVSPAVPEVSPASPPVATPRENLGVSLLPPEAPHTPPLVASGRRSVGAAGAPGTGPLAEASPLTRKVLKDIVDQEGLNEHTLEQRLDEMSQHEMLGELSDNTKGRMGALATNAPARNEIVNSVRQRAREAVDRMKSAFNRAFGENQNRAELTRVMQIDRDKEVQPFWNAFRSTQITPTPQITALMPRLEAAGALQAANRALRIEGLPTEAGFEFMTQPGEAGGQFIRHDPNITSGGPPANVQRVPTAAAFQAAKEHLDDLIERAMANPGGENEARRLTKLKNDLVQAIDEHPDARVAGIWRQARDAYATPTAQLKAMKLGERALTANIHADELPFLTASFSPAEQRAFAVGMRGHLEDVFGRPGRQELGVINKVLAPGNQSKIRWAIGDRNADELVGAIEHEARMHNAPKDIVGGSPTASRLGHNDIFQPPGGVLQNVSPSDIPHSVTGAALKAGKVGLQKLQARVGAKQAAEYARMQEEMARIFTLQGAERDEVLRELVGGQSPGGTTQPLQRTVTKRDVRGRPLQSERLRLGKENDVLEAGAMETAQNLLYKRPLVERASGGRVNPDNINHAPTEAQKEAGNYAKDHVRIHGLDLTIENPKGGERSGIGHDGRPWSVTMPAHYGYVKKTEGADGDHLDIYLGPYTRAPKVFVIDQMNAETGAFDEHKAFMGFASKRAMLDCYRRAFSDGKAGARLGDVTTMSVDRFKAWLASGDTTKPLDVVKKRSHESVGYVEKSTKPNERCGRCAMFVEARYGGPGCTGVESPIAPTGWCKRFSAGRLDR